MTAAAMKLQGASPMAEIEVKMGLEPIENLLDDRRALVEQVATARAKYGSFGVWDHMRKVKLSNIKAGIRAQYLAADKRVRVTKDQIDDEAHAHPKYVEFITLALRERTQWVKDEEQIAAIDFLINRQQAVARFVTAEARL